MARGSGTSTQHVESGDAGEHPIMHEMAPHDRGFSVPSVLIEKPCAISSCLSEVMCAKSQVQSRSTTNGTSFFMLAGCSPGKRDQVVSSFLQQLSFSS